MMQRFHSGEYIDFLKQINPDNLKVCVFSVAPITRFTSPHFSPLVASQSFSTQMQKFNVGEYTDCPVFDGLYDFCSTYTGCSLDGAVKLNHGE